MKSHATEGIPFSLTLQIGKKFYGRENIEKIKYWNMGGVEKFSEGKGYYLYLSDTAKQMISKLVSSMVT